MRIAVFCALFPPHVIGGAEISTHQLVLRLAARGHEIHVLTTEVAGPSLADETVPYTIERARLPRAYTLFEVSGQPAAKKAIWHLQDHLDPRNRRIWGRFLDRVRPDIALVPVPQGLGYNGLLELASRDVPTVAVLHDLSYVCYKTTMLRNGRLCEKPCPSCRISSRIKAGYLRAIPRLGLVSPSAANLRRVQAFVPLDRRPTAVILNPNTYPAPQVAGSRREKVRFLYVGQIAQAKGVGFLLETAAALAGTVPFEVMVVGDGRELEDLRSRFGSQPWVTFTGKVTLQDVANIMTDSDVLCVPSLWPENSPGVVIQALQLGLPVLGSAIGGIGELVRDGVSGRLLPAGDSAAWAGAMRDLIADRSIVAGWSAAASADSERFTPERAVDAYEAFLQEVLALPGRPQSGGRAHG